MHFASLWHLSWVHIMFVQEKRQTRACGYNVNKNVQLIPNGEKPTITYKREWKAETYFACSFSFLAFFFFFTIISFRRCYRKLCTRVSRWGKYITKGWNQQKRSHSSLTATKIVLCFIKRRVAFSIKTRWFCNLTLHPFSTKKNYKKKKKKSKWYNPWYTLNLRGDAPDT